MPPAVQASITQKMTSQPAWMRRRWGSRTHDDIYGLVQVHHNAVLVEDRHSGDSALGEHVHDVEHARVHRRRRKRPVRRLVPLETLRVRVRHLHVRADPQLAQAHVQLLYFLLALWRPARSVKVRLRQLGRKRETHVDGYELEQAVLCEDGDDDLVPRLAVVIKQGQPPCVGLDEQLCSAEQ